MSPYKNFIAATKSYFNSNAFLKFLLSAQIFVFAAGGLFFLLGLYITAVYEAFICLGSILIWVGLLLSIIKEDVLTIAISSGVIALGSLVGWIIGLAGRSYGYGIVMGGFFQFTPFLYFLIFGAIAIVVFIKAEKFRSMRAASAAKSAGFACPNCGGMVPYNSAFCPACGTKALQPQYAPQPQYTPPAQPAPQQAPAPQPAPPPAPQPAPPAPQASAPQAPEGTVCAACGENLPAGATFCGKCGSKQ